METTASNQHERKARSPIGQGPPSPPAAGAPIFAIGFRPFFLLAALFALMVVPYWLGSLLLHLPLSSPLPPQLWHAHEMLFGYTSAVIAGFLLTATQNWTGRVTARGGALSALLALWVAGRVASAFGASFVGLSAAIDLAFLPVLAFVVARPILHTRNRRNAAMPAMLLVLAAANAAMWAGVLRADALLMLRAQRVALDVIALLIFVIGGRIIPGFTANAIAGVRARERGALDVAGIAAMVALLALDAATTSSPAVAHCALLAGAVNAARLWGWSGSRTVGRPILLVLHFGFACTALALVLRAVALYTGAFIESIATHLLTVGGIGSMTLGMMARVALGHTGRPLVLAPAITVALCALGLGVLVRVVTPLFFAPLYVEGLVLSGALWTIAFATYAVIYAPILLAPRADGRPG